MRDDSGYSFTFDALPSEEIAFVPQSEEFLFDPEIIHVFVEQSCHLEAVHFEAVSGFFLRGQIQPAVQGVKVSVVNLSGGGTGSGGHKYSVGHTDHAGSYRLGPLPKETSTLKYEIEAVKEGYVFEKVKGQRGIFKSKKLAAIGECSECVCVSLLW